MLDPRTDIIARSLRDALITELARHEALILEHQVDEVLNIDETNEVASVLIFESRERILKFILDNFQPRG